MSGVPAWRFRLAAASLALLCGCSAVPHDDGSGGQAALRGTHASLGPAVRPEQLKGLPAAEVVRILGPADFRRSDGPAEIWQYRDGICVLDVYLYGVGPGDLRVEHAQSRDRSPLGAAAEDGCTTHTFSETRDTTSG